MIDKNSPTLIIPTSRPGLYPPQRLKTIAIIFILALAGLAGLFGLMGVLPVRAQAGIVSGAESAAQNILYVTVDGDSDAACTAIDPCALQTAVDQASDGDSIRVAGDPLNPYTAGGQPQTLLVNKTITLTGGYEAGIWDTPDTVAFETILEGGPSARVVHIQGAVSPIIENFTIRNGRADEGAGIFNDGGSPLIRNNRIYGNQATVGTQSGGGIFDKGQATIFNNEIYQNQAGTGGGIYLDTNAESSIRFNHIYSNTTSSIGGGILVDDGAQAFIEANTIHHNTASFGGGVYGLTGPIALQNNLFYRNSAVDGSGQGGAILLLGSATLWNNTIVDNSAQSDGAGIYLEGTSNTTISNNIIAFNNGGGADGIHGDTGAGTAGGYNNIFDDISNVTLTNTIKGDPLFVNPATFNYHLQESSPNVDAGDPDTPATIDLDIDGESRPFNSLVDVGADEYHPAVPNFALLPLSQDVGVDRGANTTFNHTLNNIGTATDSYTFTCSNDRGWIDTCPAPVTDLPPGDTAAISTIVAVPAGEPALAVGTTIITATSQADSSLFRVVVVRATVNPLPGLAFTPHYSNTLDPGAVITYTHRLTNTGDAPDTINVRLANDLFGWAQLLPSNNFDLTLAPGESRQVQVRITVPPYAAAGFANTVVIRATSGFDPLVTADVMDTVTANPTAGTRYVSTSGTDTNNNCTQSAGPVGPCRTIGRAISQAAAGDEIRVATGLYNVSAEMSIPTTIHIEGGWDGTFQTQSEDPGGTIIDAGQTTRIFNIAPIANSFPTINNLTLQNGHADVSGGAVLVGNFSQPTFSNLIFRQNQASRGGAFSVGSGAFVTVRQSHFVTNTAETSGGAIFINGGTVSVQQSSFSANVAAGTAADQGGGALFINAGVSFIENNLFHNNSTDGDGGALRIQNGQITFGNNTLVANQAGRDGGGLFNAGATVNLVNTIAVSNTASSGGAIYNSGSPSLVTLRYSDLWQNSLPETFQVTDGPGNMSADPNFADDQFRLRAGSPAVDAGDPATTLAIDFEEDFRPSDQGYDIGYDELAGCRAKRGDTIYGSIQEALNADSTQALILVTGICRGVHTIQVDGQTISQTVHLTQTVTIQGGWNGNFSQLTLEPTTVDPEGRGRAFYIAGDIAPVIENLIIVNGNATGMGGGPGDEAAGGGVYNLDSHPTFRAVTILTSTATLGGGFYNHTGAPLITAFEQTQNNVTARHLSQIAGNSAIGPSGNGGGLYNYNGLLTLDSVWIHHNQAANGGGLYNHLGTMDVTNIVVAKNKATANGGGIYNGAAAAAFLHMTVYSNTAVLSGGGFYNAAGSPAIRSSIFQQNQAGTGPAIRSVGGTPVIDYNYYYPQNAGAVVGASAGANSINSDTLPGLNDPEGTPPDFHLADGAPAADIADPASPVTTDFDGHIRPSNQGPDMGADEIVGCLARVNGVVYGSLQLALAAAQPGDQIDVAGRCSGVHTLDTGSSSTACGGIIQTTLHITKSVTLLGGWRDDFTARDQITTLDAQNLGHVIYIGPNITPTIQGFDIIRGNAVNGAGICIDHSGPAILGNRIYSHTATSGAAIYSDNSSGGSAVVLIDGGNRIFANEATNGAGVYVAGSSGVTVTIQNNFVYSNTAVNGAAFYSADGYNRFWHNTVVSNNASGNGGGFYVAAGSPSIRSNIVTNNTAAAGGGAYGAVGSTPDLGYNNFFANSSNWAGTIGSGGPGSLDVDPLFTNPAGLTFTIPITSPVVDKGDPLLPITTDFEGDIRPSQQGFDIGADEVGGCFARILADPLTVYGSVQQAVDLAADGDTVQVDGVCYGVNGRFNGTVVVSQTLYIDKSIILDGDWNYQSPLTATLDALGRGRTLYIAAGASVSVTNFTLRHGSAALAANGNDGGAVYNDGTLWLLNAVVQDSTAAQGGGLYNDGFLTMRSTAVVSNSATSGGGLYNNITGLGEARIEGQNRFFANSATGDGGGLYQNAGAFFLDGNRIYQNNATGLTSNGGGIYLNAGPAGGVDVRNNFIYFNEAFHGAGLYNAATNVHIWHNTFVNNVAASNQGGGLYSAAGTPDIRSNIVDSNSGTGIHIAGGGPAAQDYNNVYSNTPTDYGGAAVQGDNDISAPPLYVNPATRDYHLLDGSPGQDVADPALPVPNDYDGDIRPTNAGPDMGADENNLCLIRVQDQYFGVLQLAIDYAESFAPGPFPPVEIARGECRGVQLRNGTLQVGYVSQSLDFIGSLRRSDFADLNDYHSSDVGTVSTVINAAGTGRVIYIAPGAEPTFTHLAFVGGDATAALDGTGHGGGVYHPGGGTLRFEEAFICENFAGGNGGGYYGGAGSSADFTGMTIGFCIAARVSEGTNGQVLDVEPLIFGGNTASGDGGGLYSEGDFDVRNAGFFLNEAGGNGGGLYNTGPDNRLINATFFTNTATLSGGGIFNSGSGFAVYHNTIRNNLAASQGGGIHNSGSSFVLNSSILFANEAGSSGGGLSSSSGTLSHNNFHANVPDDSTAPGGVGSNPIIGDPGLVGIQSLSRFSRNIDQADPALWQVGVPPEPLTIDFDAQLDFRPDGHNNPEYTGLYGYNSDVGADEYFKDFGCAVEPTSQARTAEPGEVLTYTFDVTNVGNPYPPVAGVTRHGFTDTITITLDSQTQPGWSVLQGGPVQTVELGWLQSTSRILTVTVPVTATNGTQDISTIRCRSASIPSRTRTATAVTNIGLVGNLLIIPPYVDTALPGDVITYEHTIINNGNQGDTFEVIPNPGPRHASAAIVDSAGNVISNATVTLGPNGASTTVLLRVTILDTASAGEIANPGVVARSTTLATPVEASVLNRITIGFTQGTRYVSTGGADLTNCTDPENPCATIQHAVEQATSGDEIRVAAGSYTHHITRTVGADIYEQNIFIDKGVTIAGGYTTADLFTTAEPITNAVILDGEATRRVIYIADTITGSVHLNSLFIQGGYPAADSGASGYGGGIYNAGVSLVISGTWVLSNSTQFGGGLYHAAGSLTVSSSVFAGNSSDNPSGEIGEGGALYVAAGTAVLENNTFVGNQANLGGSRPLQQSSDLQSDNVLSLSTGSGGAIYQADGELALYNTIFMSNTALIGSAAFISTPVTIDHDYNLYFSQGISPTNFFITGTAYLTGNPEFIDAFYHIGPTSAAKDAGTSAVTVVDSVDFDLEPRKQGIEVDIGADERLQQPDFIFEPISQTAVITPGVPFTFTHMLTNTGDSLDSYTLVMDNQSIPPGGNWVITLTPTTTGVLNTGESLTVTLVVSGNLPGYVNQTVITATASSLISRSVMDTAIVSSTAGVDIEPSRNGSGGPTTTIVYTHTLTNTGNGVDEFFLSVLNDTPPGWPITLTPTRTGFLQAGETAPFTVTVTIPAGTISNTVHQVVIQADAFAPDASDTLTDTTTVTAAYGLLLEPDNERTVPADTTVVYTHTLTNIGNITDLVTLTVSPTSTWPVTVTPTNALLTPLATQLVTVTVVVPPGAGGLSHTAVVIATSTGGITATAVNTTTVSATVGVLLEPDHLAIVDAGDLITYTHTLTNLGDITDTFNLSATSSLGWLLDFTSGPLTLGAGESTTVVVTVSVPLTVTPGTEDITVITAASQTDPTVTASVTDTTRVRQVHGLLFTPDYTRTVSADTTVVYTHTLTNTGDGPDTFALAHSATLPWPYTVSTDTVSLGADESAVVTVTLTVPTGTSGLIHTLWLTATSVISPDTSASVTDTTIVLDEPAEFGVIIEPDNSGFALPGTIISYTHHVTNTGNVGENFNLSAVSTQGWLATVSPPAVTLAPGESQMVTVMVTVPAGASNGDQDVTTVTATSDTNPAVADSAIDITYVSTTVDQGFVFVPNHTRVVSPDSTVVYTHTLINVDIRPANFTLMGESSQGWGVTVTPPSAFLNQNESVIVTATLIVPDVTPIITDTMLVIATRTTAPMASATVTNTTIVTGTVPGGSVVIEPDDNDFGPPGELIQYQHTVTNTGAAMDTFNLSAVSSLNWPVSVFPSTVVLNPGESQVVIVPVQIPITETVGMVDTTTVRVESAADTAVFDTATDTTTVTGAPPQPPTVYLPIIFKSSVTTTPPTPTPTPTATPTATPGTPTPSPTPCSPTGIDLIVTQIVVQPNPPGGGQVATVSVTIMNQGTTSVPYGNNFYLDFYVDRTPLPLLIGDLVWGIQGVDLAAGASKTYSAPYIFSSGAHELWAQVDTDNTVNECPMEQNNVLGPIPLNVTNLGGENVIITAPPEQEPADMPRSTPTLPAATGLSAVEPLIGTATPTFTLTPSPSVTTAVSVP